MCIRHSGSTSANFHISSVNSSRSLPTLNPSLCKHCDSSSPRLYWRHQAAVASTILVLLVGVLGSIWRIVVEPGNMGVRGANACIYDGPGDGIPHCCMNWYIAGGIWGKGLREGKPHGDGSGEKLAGNACCNWFVPFGVFSAWARSAQSVVVVVLPIWSFGLKKLLPKGMRL